MQSVCMGKGCSLEFTKDHRFGVRVNKQTWRWDIESFSPGEVSVLYKGEVNTIFNWEAAWKQNLLFSVWYRLGAGMCDLTKKLVGAMGTQYDPEYDVPDTGCSLGCRTWRKYLKYMSTEYDQSMMLPTCCLLSHRTWWKYQAARVTRLAHFLTHHTFVAFWKLRPESVQCILSTTKYSVASSIFALLST